MGYRSTPLTDPPSMSAVSHAVEWVSAISLGSIATLVAGVAVAAIGFLMLTGRLPLKRGVTVVLGGFILFGAQNIAEALINSSTDLAYETEKATTQLERPALAPAAPRSYGYDPYAGASVPF
ncbi:type IV secretory pathway VirB2 component (pilin) [Sphingomonas zeicaulis]|uniref:TrbC/VirB2 family protein n=1 Tax=Sphingomonas zeicaulis TaxID=1632740 RepID=UPI003D1C6FA8